MEYAVVDWPPALLMKYIIGKNPKVTRIQMLDVYNTDAVHVKYYYRTVIELNVYVR